MKSLRRSVPLVLLLLTFFADSLFAQFVARQSWVNRYSVDAAKTNQAFGIVLAADGGVIVGGSAASTNGDLDYVLVKYTPSGTQAWLTRYDSPTHTHDEMRGMVLGSNGTVVVTGTSKTAMFDTNCTLVWAAPYGGRAVAVDASNVFVTGFSDVDFATARLDGGSGSNLWIRTHDAIGLTDLSQAITVDEAGNVFVAGDEFVYSNPRVNDYFHALTTLKYDSGGTLLWLIRDGGSPFILKYRGAEARKVSVDNTGGCWIMGNCPDPIPSYVDAHLTRRFNSNRDLEWSYSTIGFNDHGTSMAVDKEGVVYLLGSSAGNLFLIKLNMNMNGAGIWPGDYRSYHGTAKGENKGTALALDSGGNIYVCGYSPGNGTGRDIVTLKYDQNGNQQWVQRYNGQANGDDIATGLVVLSLPTSFRCLF